MRAFVIIVIVIVIALLVPPYWFGKKAESEYKNLAENVSSYENMEIASISYKRGWFQSSAEITYSIKDIEEGSVNITEKDTIYHGPIPLGLLTSGKAVLKPVLAVIDTKAQVKTESKEEYAEIINSLPDMNFTTTLSITGSGTTELSIPQIDHNLENGKMLKWSGLDGFTSFTPDLTSVSTVANSGAFNLEDETFRLQLTGINFESNLNYPATNYKNPLGNINIKIEQFSSEGKDGDQLNKVTLTNTEITASTDLKDNLLNHTHSLGFETLTVGGNDYGPGIYELQIRNIDKTAFEDMQLAIEQSENSEGTTDLDLLYPELIKLLPVLFKSSPQIELTKLLIKTGEGEISGHAIISVNGKDLDNPELATNPIFLLAALSAEMNLSVSKPLMDNLIKDYKIEEITDDMNKKGENLPSEKELQELGHQQAQSDIKNMLEQNVLILKDGKYEIKASYGLGQIKLYGKPLDINSLLNLTSGT